MKWGREHRSDLQSKYPDQWVAIVGGVVVAAGIDLKQSRGRGTVENTKKIIPTLFIDSGAHIYDQTAL